MEDKTLSDRDAALKCVDENEILYDDREKYLKRIKATGVTFPEELYGEILRNIKSCQDVFSMYLKQQIILHEPRVRYNPLSDIAGLDEKIYGLSLSSELKRSLREISQIAYRHLNEEGCLKNLVEFDIEQPASLVLFDKLVEIVGEFDMLTLVDKKGQTEVEHPDIKSINKNKATDSSENSESVSENNYTTPNITGKNKKDQGITIPKFSKQLSSPPTTTEDTEICEQAVINIVLAPRNYLYASDLYRLLIFSYLKTIRRFYCLVLHIGPLVDTQELVLYEFNIPEQIVNLIKSFDRCKFQTQPDKTTDLNFEVSLTVNKTNCLSHFDQTKPFIPINILDLNKLETTFRKTFGVNLQTVADLSDYFRYYISDCSGVKNHLEDKKARYERYMAKKAAKRERKMTRRLTRESTKDSGVFFD